jgi:hypothetical protein
MPLATMSEIQVRTLEYLRDKRRPVSMTEVRDQAAPDWAAAAIIAVIDLAREGLVVIHPPQNGWGKTVQITPHGHQALLDFVARAHCG